MEDLAELQNNSKNLNLQEIESENHFLKHTKRDSNGRFIVALPFKENQKNLGES